MLTVTDAAGARLAQMFGQQCLAEELAVRFVYEGRGIVIQQDSERTGDTTFQHEGQTVLLLDAQISEQLTELTLDLEGVQFALHPPRESDQRRP
jgi:hypothetical protein